VTGKLRGKPEDMRDMAETFVRRIAEDRRPMEREWYKSLLFKRGEQWISFNNFLRQYERSNQWNAIPRVVSNLYGPAGATIVSHLIGFDPKITFAPQTNHDDDLSTSVAANMVVNSLENEMAWPKRRAEWMPWLVFTGMAWLIAGFDPEAGPLREVIRYVCQQCGKTMTSDEEMQGAQCPNCAQQGTMGLLTTVMDKDNEPVTEMVHDEQMVCDVATPFEMFADGTLLDLKQHHMLVRIHAKDVDWARETFNDSTIGPYTHPALTVRHQRDLAYHGTVSGRTESVDITEVWCKPVPKFPNGFYMQCVGEKIHTVEAYRFMSQQGVAYFPAVYIPYERVPGSFYGTTPMFGIMEKQVTINRLDAMTTMIMSRMAAPTRMIPMPGTKIPATGIVGAVVEVDLALTQGQFPRTDEGVDLKPGFANYRREIVQEIDRMLGLSEISHGTRPQNTRSAEGIDRLQQVASIRSTTVYDNISQGTAEFDWIILEMFRTSQDGPAKYARILGSDARWTISKLEAADLKGGVDTWAEPAATLPKSHNDRLATMEMFLEKGLLNPQDPLVLAKLYKQFGVDNIFPDLSAEDSYITRELEKLKAGQPVQPGPFDHHAQHFARQSAYVKGEEFETLDPQVQQIIVQHVMMHQQILMEQQAAEQQQQPPPEQQDAA